MKMGNGWNYFKILLPYQHFETCSLHYRSVNNPELCDAVKMVAIQNSILLLYSPNRSLESSKEPCHPHVCSAVQERLESEQSDSQNYRILFLEALAELRKATISFVMSVCPSGRPCWC